MVYNNEHENYISVGRIQYAYIYMIEIITIGEFLLACQSSKLLNKPKMIVRLQVQLVTCVPPFAHRVNAHQLYFVLLL